jgi:hypothetical protein
MHLPSRPAHTYIRPWVLHAETFQTKVGLSKYRATNGKVLLPFVSGQREFAEGKHVRFLYRLSRHSGNFARRSNLQAFTRENREKDLRA